MNAQKIIEDFNKDTAIGSKVAVRQDGHDGRMTITTTRSQAYLMCGQPVVFLEGISGCYSLGHVHKIENPETL